MRLGHPLLVLALLPLGLVAPAAARPLPQVGLRVDATVAEGDTTRVIVTLDRAARRAVTVRLDTRSAHARSIADYTPLHQTVTIPAGRLHVGFVVNTVTDGLDEPGEGFVVRLSAPDNAVLAAARETVVIEDRDPRPRVRPQDATVLEPSTRNQLGFTEVRLSAPSGRRVVVHLATRPGTATVADFVPLNPVVVFAPGQTSQPVSVEVLPDDRVEGPETVRLVVTSTRHARPPNRPAVITIEDADS